MNIIRAILFIIGLVLAVMGMTSCAHIDKGVCRHRVFESYYTAVEYGPAKIAWLEPVSGSGNWHIVTYAPVDGKWKYWEPSKGGGFWLDDNLDSRWKVHKWVTVREAEEIVMREKNKNESLSITGGIKSNSKNL